MNAKNYFKDCFFAPRFFWAIGVCVVFYIISFYFIAVWPIAVVASLLLLFLSILDYGLLFFQKKGIVANRSMESKFSNGDENPVQIFVHNQTNMNMQIEIIDEVPIQFQIRNFSIKRNINGFEKLNIDYRLRPVKRGEYAFGNLHILASSPIGFVIRRFTQAQENSIKVYPSFLQLRKEQLRGIANQDRTGNNKLTKLANSLEFDHIKEYTQGDDIRTINWKATARKNAMMVNTYTDERSQQIYCVIDKGRIMKMPFDGMTLLDYAVNAVLMMSYTILHKNDKAGLITFSERHAEVIKANKNKSQFLKITESLYKQETNFLESNYESLMQAIRYEAGQRSLIMLFTNFETTNALERHMPYLKSIARKHLLCVVLFENVELKNIHEKYTDSLEGIYVKTITDRFHFEKKRILKELSKEGILSIFTTPENLSTASVNTYLDLKTKRII